MSQVYITSSNDPVGTLQTYANPNTSYFSVSNGGNGNYPANATFNSINVNGATTTNSLVCSSALFLNVNASSTVTSTLTVNGNSSIGGNLTVTGSISGGTLEGINANVNTLQWNRLQLNQASIAIIPAGQAGVIIADPETTISRIVLCTWQPSLNSPVQVPYISSINVGNGFTISIPNANPANGSATIGYLVLYR